MADRIQEILSWYSSDNAGTRTNIARLLRHGKLAGQASWSSYRSTKVLNMVRREALRPILLAITPSTIFNWPSMPVAMHTRLHWDFSKPAPLILPDGFR